MINGANLGLITFGVVACVASLQLALSQKHRLASGASFAAAASDSAARGPRGFIGEFTDGSCGLASARRQLAHIVGRANYVAGPAVAVIGEPPPSGLPKNAITRGHSADVVCTLPPEQDASASYGTAGTFLPDVFPALVLLVHVYNLALVNDLVNHGIGDGVGEQVLVRLWEVVGREGMAFGIKEDQFVVGVYEGNDEVWAHLVQLILQMLRTPVKVLGYDVQLSASIGSVVRSGRPARLEELVSCARIAARAGRKDGRSEHVRYSPRQRLSHARQLILGGQIADGIEKDEFHSFYQPIATTDANRIVGAESLCRWFRPGAKEVSPATFIPVAEETGTIQALTARVMASAFEQSRRWRDAGFPLLLSVNMSAREFDATGVVELLDARAQAAGLEPREIQLEITESLLMEDRRASFRTLARLRDLGFRIALDDFGKGYSSLSYFKDFQVDTVKIDKAFIQGVLPGTRDAAILRSIVAMTQEAGAVAVAEGVETEAELAFVRGLGITHYQGFLLARPCCANSFEKQLLRSTR